MLKTERPRTLKSKGKVMSLKNETRQVYENTKTFYREYTRGMTSRRLGKEFKADSRRIKELYDEAIGSESSEPAHKSGNIRFFRLLSSLVTRLTPARRLAFAAAFLLILLFFFATGPLSALSLPVSFIILVTLLFLELLEKSDAKKELDLAKEIQISLFPKSVMSIQNLDLVSFASTATDVGGDYVDVVYTKKGTFYIIADVSGKGLSAALYMIRLQALVHFIIKKHSPDPREFLLLLNDHIKSFQKDRTFVTACVAFFPSDASYVKICRAGHNPPLFYQAGKKRISELRSDGLALGMTKSDILKKHLKELTIKAESGDHFLFYTDGLTEARNGQKEQYGEERLMELFELYASLDAKELVKKIEIAIEEFVSGEKLYDDITFTSVHIKSEMQQTE